MIFDGLKFFDLENITNCDITFLNYIDNLRQPPAAMYECYCKCHALPVRLSRLSECMMKVPATEMAYQNIFYNITAKKCFVSIMQEVQEIK